jgi:outer membrane lipoprotein SlyB
MRKCILATLISVGLLGEVMVPVASAATYVKHFQNGRHVKTVRYSRNRSGRRRARNVAIGAAGGAAGGAILGRGRGAGVGAVVGGTAGAIMPTRRR